MPPHDDGHDHEHGPPDPSTLRLLDGLERHELRSVGIDIGSATSHLVTSRLVLQRLGSGLSSEFVVSERETLHRGPIWLTPYEPGGATIDTAALRALFEDAYRAAGIWPHEVDTGAVVITGEALRKENAEAIARLLAEWSGRLVCVSAGPNHEALLAAHGSGSVALSATGRTVVNVDVGGGTTKVSVLDHGAVTHVEAFSVGARLLAFDGDLVTRREEPAAILAGRPIAVGERVPAAERTRIAEVMARVVLARLTGQPDDLHGRLLVATDGAALPGPDDIDDVVFSGGVSEFLTEHAPAGFGDLGAELGRALRIDLAASPLAGKVRTAASGIRATVLGAGQFTVQVSGQTCFVAGAALPATGLRAIPIDLTDLTGDAPERAVRAALRRHDLDGWQPDLAAVLTLPPAPRYPALRRAAEAVAAVATPPLHLVLRADLAHSLGTVLTRELGWTGPLVVIDGITVDDLDHVDIGPPLGGSGALPVTVTSLEFPTAEQERR
jgi:ethanolamine utilization protein EutA